jgi:SAM-dependent methyltransferase
MGAKQQQSLIRFDPNGGLIETLYAMMLDELECSHYEAWEVAMFKDPIRHYGRYLNPETREYALQNAVSNISAAVEYLSRGGTHPKRLLDLGCGLGMQSIIFAALGWEVVGVDVAPRCIALCRKRQRYFEARLGRELAMQFVAIDFLKADPNSLGGKCDALFSMSALAYIQPLQETVAKVSSILSSRSRVLLWDRNPGYLFLDGFGLRHRRIPRPTDVREEFSRHGFSADLLRGGCAIPRQFWRPKALNGAIPRLNGLLKKRVRLSFSYLLGASREMQL